MRTPSPKHPVLAFALLAPVACGDSGMGPTTTTITTADTSVNPSQVTGETTTTGTPTTAGPGTDTGSGGVSDSESSPTSTGDPSGPSSSSSTGPTTATTGPVTATDGGTTLNSTGPECVCDPGSTNGCDQGEILTCTPDCLGFEPMPCPNGQSCVGDMCTAGLCNPGQIVCEDADTEKVCNAQGDGFDPPVQCGPTEECAFGQGCTEVCELILDDPSSVGCVFRANKMQNFIEEPTAVTVGNVSKTLTATVSMFYFQNGAEMMVAGPVQVMPGKSTQFNLTMPPQPGSVSVLRPDSTFKIVSNVPVVAYQHSPIMAMAHNDSSMLLPDHAQQKNYIIAAFTPSVGGNPAYFNVIGLKDGTTVNWVSPVATQAGNGVPAVPANTPGQVIVGDYDLLQVSSGQSDLSGTIVTLSEPGWVAGAVQCVNVPANITFCDHIEEQMIPIEYWGLEYVGAHAPQRGSEDYWWRVYASEDNTTITTAPVEPGFPKVLNKGQFYEFKTTNSFIFSGDKPFMPVQYLESQDGGANTGDPASYQMVPVEQFLDRYVFVTGIGYNPNYVQVVRDAGAADVLVDGVVVNGYYAVGAYEVADWKINEGSHLAESAAPFGIYQVGYTGVTSYAYPGGLRLKVINPQ
jgi:hypothetical protein